MYDNNGELKEVFNILKQEENDINNNVTRAEESKEKIHIPHYIIIIIEIICIGILVFNISKLPPASRGVRLQYNYIDEELHQQFVTAIRNVIIFRIIVFYLSFLNIPIILLNKNQTIKFIAFLILLFEILLTIFSFVLSFNVQY